MYNKRDFERVREERVARELEERVGKLAENWKRARRELEETAGKELEETARAPCGFSGQAARWPTSENFKIKDDQILEVKIELEDENLFVFLFDPC